MRKKITAKELEKEVAGSPDTTLVQFETPWSGACKILSPLYEELARTYRGKAKFFSIDTEQEEGIGAAYGITEYPTILFFRKGKLVDHMVGLASRNILIEKIENLLKSK